MSEWMRGCVYSNKTILLLVLLLMTSLVANVNLPTASIPELCGLLGRSRDGESDPFVSIACGLHSSPSSSIPPRTLLRVCGQAAVRLESGVLGADSPLGNLYARSFDDEDKDALCSPSRIDLSLRKVRVPLEDDLAMFTKRACESLLVGSPDSELYKRLCVQR